MKTLLFLLLVSVSNAATLWHNGGLFYTVVVEKNNLWDFRYSYQPEHSFVFPNKEYVLDYSVEYEKVTFERFSSPYPPQWGTVLVDNKPFQTYVPVPECGYLAFLGGLLIFMRRR